MLAIGTKDYTFFFFFFYINLRIEGYKPDSKHHHKLEREKRPYTHKHGKKSLTHTRKIPSLSPLMSHGNAFYIDLNGAYCHDLAPVVHAL